MNIKCSAGKGELPMEDCLVCAMSGSAPCGYDYSLLRALYGTNEKTERMNEIHVTDLTGCLRKAYFSKKCPVSETPHEMLTRSLGTFVHAGLEGSDTVMESELPFEAEDVKGRIDILYTDGRLVDIKTTRWLDPQKVPYGSHVLQVNIYAYFMKRAEREVNRLQIQYIDMSGPTKCRACKIPVGMVAGECRCPSCGKTFPSGHLGALLVNVPFMDEGYIQAEIEQRKGALKCALAEGQPPEKEPGFLCSYCPFAAELCHPNIYEP